MRLLQWNILYKENPDYIIKFIKEYSPDIVCLQELAVKPYQYPHISNVASYIASKTSMNFYSEEAQRWVDDIEMDATGNGIFTKHKINRKFAKYIQEPAVGSKDYANEGRIYIECDIEISDQNYTIGTTHMSYTHKFEITEAKKQEVDNLIDIIDINKKKYIFSGDLNSLPSSYTIKRLSEVLTNCGPSNNKNTWTTKPFEYQGFKANTLDWRLDYVFSSSDMYCHSSEIINTKYSDHLPIIAEFKLDTGS
ncbi:MAG: endonuclease/exonuclease/phosphatase family protein [Patescibacteria group bacterium]|jgi:endonuclease/exonuclease/phosphatase family metal-dependent hydrolase|nr:endonuclease/exonuclease/phosphatase family protein [Patescibacteria group bacterium]